CWEGSYTVNGYPAEFNAPDEGFSDPELEIAADGSGALTAEFSIGAGETSDGDPFEATEFGRLTLATFSAGSISHQSSIGFRATPDYQRVLVPSGVSGQTTSCSTDGGGTGWWGAWPSEFLSALNSHDSGKSVIAHYYSTGCGGKQDNKPPLPLDLS